MEEVVIVGGGVAGLSCLNALLDKHISPLLLEASTIGSPKMCGEFLAPPVIEQLHEWGIGPIQTIKQARFNDVQFSFPCEAGAYSRRDAELELASRAATLGGRMVEQTPIKNIIPATDSSPFILHLSSGEIIHARHVIFASGQFSQRVSTSIYVGFKTHIPQVIEPETLLMFSLAGGYFGIVPVTSETSNLTCLIKREMIEKAGSCRAFFDCLPREYGKQLTLDWLEGPAPTFGLKSLPNWPHAYWIGDAFASIYPAIGYGFAHSVSSALLAVEYYLQRNPIGYHQELDRLMRPKRLIGKCMHHLLQKPRLCKVVSSLFGSNPWLSHQLLKTLDY
ncbi:MAG: FAD-dependent oxidoreductase [Gammaproteobacteria bacterium]|nr:FAD-dependent oxidoreductase [Gammaproteobacteria bacterium]